MHILLFGRGVIATLYGWALEGAGHTVDFYVRPGRAAQLGPAVRLAFHDLRPLIVSPSYQEVSWPIRLREDLPADHPYDLILVSLGHHQVAEALAFLAPRVNQATVLLLANFWADPQAAAAILPAGQFVWGFPAAGGGFQPNGELAGALFADVELGTAGLAPTARELAVQRLFRTAGFTVREHRNFRDWLWTHFAVSAAFTAQQLRAGSSRRAVYENQDHSLEAAVEVVHEVVPLLAARGVVVAQQPELTFFTQPAAQVVYALYQRLQNPAFQAAIDGHANPAELRYMFWDVLGEGRRLGVPLPSFEAAARQVNQNP